MLTNQTRMVIAAVIITCLVLFMVDNNFSSINETVFKVDTSQYHSYSEPANAVRKTGEGRNRTGLLFDHCVLNEIDPWDATIDQYFHYDYNPLKNCKRTVHEVTKLKNGKLYVIDNRINIQCWWRCLQPKNDYHYTSTDWKKLINGTIPECDVVETKCRESILKDRKKLKKGVDLFKKQTFYEFLHAQAYRNINTEPVDNSKKLEQPDVHIILFDSVSESQFIRSMPKTRHYLREYYDAISFRYLNKIGLNSRPNGLALLMGKTLNAIMQSPMSVGYSSDYVNKSACSSGLDDDQFIGFQYQEAGYKTLMSEDWALGVFNWPNCWGFRNKTPVDHYMRPFQLRIESKQYQTEMLKKSIYKGVCRESHVPQIEYLQSLLENFPDKPKFTTTWMSYISHDNVNGLFHADNYFYNFFKNNNPKLNNSYLFIMGDHGMRFGSLRKTPIGEREDNNPFLFMALPGKFRDNKELLSNVRSNAHQLISHYDLYATFADIVAPYRPNNSQQILIRGTSLLQPLPQPRTCDRLRIPFEYCICENKKTTLIKNIAPGQEAAALMVENMNNLIQSLPLKKYCTKLKLSNDSIHVEKFQFEGSMTIFRVTYKTVPGNGEFWGYVGQEVNSKKLKILSEQFPRLDSYFKTAFCAKSSPFAGYCYCKSLLKTTTTTTVTSSTKTMEKKITAEPWSVSITGATAKTK